MVRKVVAIFLVSVFLAEFAYACPCGPQLTNDEKFFMVKILDGCPCSENKSVEQAYRQSDGVFIGKVVDLHRGEYKILNLITDEYQEVTLNVIKTYKGKIQDGKVIVRTGTGNSDCGYPFALNKEYLVYGSLYKGNLYSTNACTRTKEIAPGIGGELDTLEKLKGSLELTPQSSGLTLLQH